MSEVTRIEFDGLTAKVKGLVRIVATLHKFADHHEKALRAIADIMEKESHVQPLP